nr:NAD(P)H-hydrate dehydratase [uncultured Sphingomonas sp.]
MTRPILTAGAMRDAEQGAIRGGTSAESLMERAGQGLAEAIALFTGPRPALILCGSGNNGGDGYVAARYLAERGFPVRVAALGVPTGDAARRAREHWQGTIEQFGDAPPAPLIVDCLFGTGLNRGLEGAVSEFLLALVGQAAVAVACDLPSGVSADNGAILSPIAHYHLTVTFGALKPAHRLAPAMHHMGRVVLADIGVKAATDWHEIGEPAVPALTPDGHKYHRGLVHCLAGEMPGAIALSASAALRSGAGYVRVSTSRPIVGIPDAVVQTGTANLKDPRIGCIVVGPGMGDLPQLLTLALTSHAPKVIDADAIAHIGDPDRMHGQGAILTPHEGEFVKLFGSLEGSKPARALSAATRSQSVIIYKGADTLVASPDGRLAFAPPAPAWLATVGTGDVLAGMIAAMRARGLEAFEAACAGVWLHGRAAEMAGPHMIADDLVTVLGRP